MSKGQKRMAHGVKPGDRGPSLEAGVFSPSKLVPGTETRAQNWSLGMILIQRS